MQKSGKELQTGDSFFDDIVYLTDEDASEFVMSWYLAIFGWGIIINELRIIVISFLAPIKA